MNIDELVGENVRRARVSAGLSSHELAHRVTGVGLPLADTALLRLESGEDRLGVDELIALGLALGMPPAMLLSPLNLGSLLWVDAEGRPMASWALFHDDARSFSPPQQEGIPAGAGRALGAAPAPKSPAAEPPPPPTPPPAVTGPAAAPAPILPAEKTAAPATLRLVQAETESVTPVAAEDGPDDGPAVPPDPAPREEPFAGLGKQDAPDDGPGVLPPDPAPWKRPIAGLGEEGDRPIHRDWALEALQSLQMPARDA
ncbi:MAG TPA: helix-turn-helix transcriptional regulator [Acidimicrobiia bacterium]|nr:helix-turn-helix transcriptional regulator [Acidimicrobiia bacterium]